MAAYHLTIYAERYTQPVRHAPCPRTHGAVRLTDWYQYGTSCPAARQLRARACLVQGSRSPRRSHDSIFHSIIPTVFPSVQRSLIYCWNKYTGTIYREPEWLSASTKGFGDYWRERADWIPRGRGMCPRRSLKMFSRACVPFGRLILFVIEFRTDRVPVSGSTDTLSLVLVNLNSRWNGLRPGVVRILRAVYRLF